MSTIIKTNYLGIHETQYQKLRENNENGWMDQSYKIAQFNRLKDLINQYTTKDRLKILELGCGDAELSLMFAKDGHNVTGVDISPTAIEWANEKAMNRKLSTYFCCSSVTNLPFESEFFDIVIDSACLHCIIGNDRNLLFQEVKRILLPNGIFIGETMCDFIPPFFKEYSTPDGLIVKNGVAGRYIGKSNAILKEIRSAQFKELFSKISIRSNDDESDELLFIFKKKV